MLTGEIRSQVRKHVVASASLEERLWLGAGRCRAFLSAEYRITPRSGRPCPARRKTARLGAGRVDRADEADRKLTTSAINKGHAARREALSCLTGVQVNAVTMLPALLLTITEPLAPRQSPHYDAPHHRPTEWRCRRQLSHPASGGARHG